MRQRKHYFSYRIVIFIVFVKTEAVNTQDDNVYSQLYEDDILNLTRRKLNNPQYNEPVYSTPQNSYYQQNNNGYTPQNNQYILGYDYSGTTNNNGVVNNYGQNKYNPNQDGQNMGLNYYDRNADGIENFPDHIYGIPSQNNPNYKSGSFNPDYNYSPFHSRPFNTYNTDLSLNQNNFGLNSPANIYSSTNFNAISTTMHNLKNSEVINSKPFAPKLLNMTQEEHDVRNNTVKYKSNFLRQPVRNATYLKDIIESTAKYKNKTVIKETVNVAKLRKNPVVIKTNQIRNIIKSKPNNFVLNNNRTVTGNFYAAAKNIGPNSYPKPPSQQQQHYTNIALKKTQNQFQNLNSPFQNLVTQNLQQSPNNQRAPKSSHYQHSYLQQNQNKQYENLDFQKAQLNQKALNHRDLQVQHFKQSKSELLSKSSHAFRNLLSPLKLQGTKSKFQYKTLNPKPNSQVPVLQKNPYFSKTQAQYMGTTPQSKLPWSMRATRQEIADLDLGFFTGFIYELFVILSHKAPEDTRALLDALIIVSDEYVKSGQLTEMGHPLPETFRDGLLTLTQVPLQKAQSLARSAVLMMKNRKIVLNKEFNDLLTEVDTGFSEKEGITLLRTLEGVHDYSRDKNATEVARNILEGILNAHRNRQAIDKKRFYVKANDYLAKQFRLHMRRAEEQKNNKTNLANKFNMSMINQKVLDALKYLEDVIEKVKRDELAFIDKYGADERKIEYIRQELAMLEKSSGSKDNLETKLRMIPKHKVSEKRKGTNVKQITDDNVKKKTLYSKMENKDFMEELSYSKDEKEFEQFLLVNAIKDSDFILQKYRGIEDLEKNRWNLDGDSSNTDEESLLKRNIYKVFGYDVDKLS